jgi:ssDNA-binding Zn-finger/Zn-ribbon topoisomerase 1
MIFKGTVTAEQAKIGEDRAKCSCGQPLIYELDGIFRERDGFTLDEQKRCVIEGCPTCNELIQQQREDSRVNRVRSDR